MHVMRAGACSGGDSSSMVVKCMFMYHAKLAINNSKNTLRVQ